MNLLKAPLKFKGAFILEFYRMNFLIVDLNITLDGHKLGFVQQIYQHLLENNKITTEHTFHFLINVPIAHTDDSGIKIHVPPVHFEQKNAVRKYREQWHYIKNTAKTLGIDKIILLEFDIYQAELGKESINSFDISGILFRPYYRIAFLGQGLTAKIQFHLKKLQKILLFNWSLRSPSVKEIFILNDASTVEKLNNKRNQIKYLADPAFDYKCQELLDIREFYGISKERKIFLAFGYIDDRKNIPNITAALNSMGHTNRSKVTLMIIGKTAINYKDKLDSSLKTLSPEVQLIHKDEFVDDCQMQSLFAQCDLVLRMNINFFASSGIIGQAAKYNKPSLVSNYGILAEITEDYQLGKMVDPLNIPEIKAHFEDYLNNPWEIDGQAYYLNHNRAAFVSTLLGLA